MVSIIIHNLKSEIFKKFNLNRLNEGFASWVEYLGYNKTHPEWRDLDSFFVQKLSTLVKDSLESTHAISLPVDNPNEINALFDAISYDKVIKNFLYLTTICKTSLLYHRAQVSLE